MPEMCLTAGVFASTVHTKTFCGLYVGVVAAAQNGEGNSLSHGEYARFNITGYQIEFRFQMK
jgi:hypothetical protein